MTPCGPTAGARQNRGRSIVRIGVVGLVGGAVLSRLLVVLGGILGVIAMSGLTLAGRAITVLEELSR